MSTQCSRLRAPRNRTLTLSVAERSRFQGRLLTLTGPADAIDLEDRVVNQDFFRVLKWLPDHFVDLLFLDPPYNLTKSFNGNVFRERSTADYATWLESWLPQLLRTLKPEASVYLCADWRSSTAVHLVAERHLQVHNRITWEREKGRGAKNNWKNCSEDVWFCSVSKDYYFNVEAVKLRRRVIAPYKDKAGNPKDWQRTDLGGLRLTHPANVWNDLTVPFWSMPENTDHPTQKPEKLLAKIVLASTRPGDMLFDPFLGSGTAAVVAKKLGRRYFGIECDTTYCCLTEKRLDLADRDSTIQGYSGGVFWERNSVPPVGRRRKTDVRHRGCELFGPGEDEGQ